jgi:YD repeat-containing protein
LRNQNKSVTPGGTISRTVFDARGHAIADYVGTDDSSATDADPTGAGGDPHLVVCTSGASSSSSSPSSSSGTPDPNNNMVLVAEREYCDGSSGCSCGGGGAGNLVSETRHVNATTSHTTDFEYDWRGRQLHVVSPADDADRVVYTKATYDNLDRATKQERYLEISDSADRLLARSETFYDNLGRVYQTKRYAVDVSDGTVGNALVSNTWFDDAGNAIKQQSAGSQAFTKTVYDSLGRAVKQYVGHDTDETAYADASSVSDDTIVEQVETVFDDAGNVLQATTRQRFHNATGTGELTSPSGTQPKARVTSVAMYHDEIGRQVAVANYGTYGGATFSRAAVVPTRTDTILVTSTDYNDAGQAYRTVDPAGREDRQEFDDAGRVVKTIQNYVDGVVSAAASDEDVTVEMTYNADGQLSTLTAKNPTTGDQTTTYVYGTTLTDSEIATSTLKRAEIYPDSDDTPSLGDGTDGVFDRIEFCYNRQSQRTAKKDQNGSIHEYEFDALGRMTGDKVTTLGTGVDNSVRRIETEYEVRGMVTELTSYDAASAGNVVNQVVFEHDDSELLVKEYQEHSGAKDANTQYIQYNHDATASSGAFSRGLRLGFGVRA